MKPDFVAELLVIIARASSIDDETRDRIEQDIRDAWGGQEVKIRRKRPVTTEDIDSRLRQRMAVREIAQEFGTSRHTIYRRLGLKSRRKRPT